jgi:uncharacterized protein
MVKRILVLLTASCSLTFAAGPSPAGPSKSTNPPSEASIKQLLEVTHARQLVDSMMSQLDGMMKSALEQVTQGQPVPAEVQKTFDQGRSEVVATLKEQFTWEKLEPMYVRIYQKSLTQEELDGMIQFYRTPSGQALINKMPLIFQNSMAEVQQMMAPMMQRIQRMQKDMMAQMQAAKGNKTGS